MRLGNTVTAGQNTVCFSWHDDKWYDLIAIIKSEQVRYPWIANKRIELRDVLENTNDLSEIFSTYILPIKEEGLLNQYQLPQDMKFKAPILRPTKIIALGRNYLAHAHESGLSVPVEPIIFCKAPSSIIGPHEPIIYPEMLDRVDPEIELAVIIGRRAKNVSRENAFSYVAGYTILNDVSARNMQAEDLKIYSPWFRSKSFDTFCPLGPYLVLKDEIPDPHNLELKLTVNGEIRQHSNTKNMIFKLPDIISFITAHLTLVPGDIIATGTPEGMAPLYRGDVINCTISGLGTLENTIE